LKSGDRENHLQGMPAVIDPYTAPQTVYKPRRQWVLIDFACLSSIRRWRSHTRIWLMYQTHWWVQEPLPHMAPSGARRILRSLRSLVSLRLLLSTLRVGFFDNAAICRWGVSY